MSSYGHRGGGGIVQVSSDGVHYRTLGQIAPGSTLSVSSSVSSITSCPNSKPRQQPALSKREKRRLDRLAFLTYRHGSVERAARAMAPPTAEAPDLYGVLNAFTPAPSSPMPLPEGLCNALVYSISLHVIRVTGWALQRISVFHFVARDSRYRV